MKKLFLITFLLLTGFISSFSQQASVVIHGLQGSRIIPKEIYGQFSEHLGSCIYGGIWVGEKSRIPNINGYRTDVLNALKELHIPVLRWPGGCFADDYHWMDGIGPRDKRPKTVNDNWGGTVEDNSFGTHEFLNLCELLHCEPYICGNVGSGSVDDLSKWIEYMTSSDDSRMTQLRRANGRDKPWKVKYIGVGNESWGCGGNMRPEYYADIYRRYSKFCWNYNGNNLFKIACGASDYDYKWTDVLMNNAGKYMDGLSLHYYTVGNWNHKGSATDFSDEEYYSAIAKCLDVENVIQKHCSIMDSYDKDKRVALMLDEWGTWWDSELNSTSLFQQNTIRDALVAALSFNIFHKYTDRLKMANIAQVVNVLQAMILTKDKAMVLTPTYYVFKMYRVHQDATYLPVDLSCDSMKVGRYTLPLVSATVSKDNKGMIHLSLVNISLDKMQEVTVKVQGIRVAQLNGEILTSLRVSDHNTFEQPNFIGLRPFKDMKFSGDILNVRLPAKSIVTIALN